MLVGLWYGSTLDLDPKFLQSLYDYQHLMQDYVRFQPYLMSLQCPNCVTEVRDKECISGGLYCLIPPKDAIGSQFNVTDDGLMMEALFGRCLHEVVKTREPDLLSYFNYLYNTRNTCFKQTFMGVKNNDTVTTKQLLQCAKDQIWALSVDPMEVE